MLITALQLAAGIAALYFGGGWLVRGACVLASRIGISPLAIGLTVVAFGTSMPELVVSLDAAMAGANDISVGNVVGSNIANVALILGAAALLNPARVEAKILRVDAPIMILATMVMVLMLMNDRASRFEGTLLVCGLVAFTAYTLWESRRESKKVQDEFAAAVGSEGTGLLRSVVLVIIGLGLLVVGGHLVVTAAIVLATTLGLSQAAIGLTIVAVGTSLPEAATSVIAAARGQGDIAIGNVIGSNIFNILAILGVTTIVHPLTLGDITAADLTVMLLLSIALAFMLHTQRCLDRKEGGILLASYVAYTIWQFAG